MKNQDSLIGLLQDADIYGYNVIVPALKDHYEYVSFCKGSIPTVGSLCRPAKELRNSNVTEIEKAIIHKNGAVTLKTNKGYLKFLNL